MELREIILFHEEGILINTPLARLSRGQSLSYISGASGEEDFNKVWEANSLIRGFLKDRSKSMEEYEGHHHITDYSNFPSTYYLLPTIPEVKAHAQGRYYKDPKGKLSPEIKLDVCFWLVDRDYRGYMEHYYPKIRDPLRIVNDAVKLLKKNGFKRDWMKEPDQFHDPGPGGLYFRR
jgi:hypothetical protein